MRITKARKQENHGHIVAVASEMFRQRGFDGVGIAEVMERAGLTHGGFYNHFAGKQDLIAEASATAFFEIADRYAGQDATVAVQAYISRGHRDARGSGCPAAALGCEAARQPEETRDAFSAGIEALLRGLEDSMSRNQDSAAGVRAQAICVLAQAVGAIILSRACPDESALADELLDACRADCIDMIANRSSRR